MEPLVVLALVAIALAVGALVVAVFVVVRCTEEPSSETVPAPAGSAMSEEAWRLVRQANGGY